MNVMEQNERSGTNLLKQYLLKVHLFELKLTFNQQYNALEKSFEGMYLLN